MAGVWVAVGVTGFFGIAFVGFAFFSMMKKSVLKSTGARTTGVVVRFDEGGEDCDIPVIEFQVDKETYTTEGVGSMPPAYKVVMVVYLLGSFPTWAPASSSRLSSTAWQATRAPSMSISSGRSLRQRSLANGQRG